MTEKLAELINNYKIEIDNYNTTLEVVKIFGHEMCCNPGEIEPQEGSICWCGRRMTTSENNLISPETDVTPDIITKINKHFGAVTEVKQSLPQDTTYWEKTFKQIIKYDDQLQGWNETDEENINHDVILLIPDRLRVNVEDYITEKTKNNEFNTTRNFAIVSYYRDSRVHAFYSLCRFFGKLSNTEKDEELRKIQRVPAVRVIPKYNFFFYDYPPPLPYTMVHVWEYISNYIDEDQFIGDKKEVKIEIDGEKLVQDLKEANCPIINVKDDYCAIDDHRNPSLPRAEWVREALKKLEKLEYLEETKTKGKYLIALNRYKKMRWPLDTFSKKLAQKEIKKKAKKEPAEKQMALFH